MIALSNKRKAFIEAYLRCWNATKAAEEAGYKHPRQQGSRLLSNVDIQAVIKQRLKEMHMAADEALALLSDQARADLAMFLTNTGAIDFQKVKEHGQLVKRISHTKGRNSSIELHDSQNAIIQILKLHGMYREVGDEDRPLTMNIRYVNDWRNYSALPTSGSTGGAPPSAAVQLAGSGPEVEEDDASDGNSS